MRKNMLEQYGDHKRQSMRKYSDMGWMEVRRATYDRRLTYSGMEQKNHREYTGNKTHFAHTKIFIIDIANGI